MDLVEGIRQFVERSTVEVVERIAASLESFGSWDNAYRLPQLPAAGLNSLVAEFVREGRRTGRQPSEVAFALRAACAVETRRRQSPQIELVLSGPTFAPFEMRRTDEALLEVIQSARQRVTVISFAMYRVDRVIEALAGAVKRDVEVRMFVELDKLRVADLRRVYGHDLIEQIQLYMWAKSQERSGVLHAKATIADGERMFLSSANLTENAMSLNIEIGVLIRGGDHPRKVEQLFDTYLSKGLFEKLNSK